MPVMGADLLYEKPAIVDLGTLTAHTFDVFAGGSGVITDPNTDPTG